MLSRRHIALAFALASLAFGANAAFAHHAQIPFAEVAQSSDLVFVGTVVSQTPRVNDAGSMVFTDVTFVDVEIVNASGRSRQQAAPSITLAFPGGTVGDLTVRLCDS